MVPYHIFTRIYIHLHIFYNNCTFTVKIIHLNGFVTKSKRHRREQRNVYY